MLHLVKIQDYSPTNTTSVNKVTKTKTKDKKNTI